MYSIARIEELIAYSESTLNKYQAVLANNPTNLLAKGMVKNTLERLSELQGNLAFEKRIREKEVIELRLMGKAAKLGRLSLDLLGDFSKQLSNFIIEAGRQYQYGNHTGRQKIDLIKNTIDLKFERLVPGSTKVLVTGNTSPDLFGNSIIEGALQNSFELLNSKNGDELIDATNKIGHKSIESLNKLFKISISNDLEFEFNWKAPNDEKFSWVGEMETIKRLSNSISHIKPTEPEKIDFEGNLYSESLKGFIEIQEGDSKPIKIYFANEMLETIKDFAIGDVCVGTYEKKTFINTVTSVEKNTYNLIEIVSK